MQAAGAAPRPPATWPCLFVLIGGELDKLDDLAPSSVCGQVRLSEYHICQTKMIGTPRYSDHTNFVHHAHINNLLQACPIDETSE